MIYIEIGDCFLNANHIILVRPQRMTIQATGETINGSEVIYGFTEYIKSISSQKSPKELIRNIREQIKKQINGNPKIAEMCRFELLDME